MPRKIKIGIIGGTGIDDPNILEHRTEKKVTTPFGEPSDALVLGQIEGVDCVLLARHGRQHQYSPTNVNYRANIHALKAEGCTHVIVSTACGSLVEEAKPGDIVILDQFIDRTTQRKLTFYDGTATDFYPSVAHIPMSDPFCPELRQIMIDGCKELEFPHLPTGTIIVCEGPRFSSRAESKMFRMWGGTVISMTAVPEVCLAKEAGLLYSSAALVTDYDCWRDDGEPVSVEFVMKTMQSNSSKARKLFLACIKKIAEKNWDKEIGEAEAMAKGAIM